MYFVYILYSPTKDKYYIGQKEDMERKLETHNLRKNLGANDWQLKVLLENFVLIRYYLTATAAFFRCTGR